jgi:hypothetical protein
MNIGENLKAKALVLSHASLERTNDESAYKSNCPVCKIGVLLVQRDLQEPLHLMNYDRCSMCAQAVVYTDSIIGCEPVKQVGAVYDSDPRPQPKPAATSWARLDSSPLDEEEIQCPPKSPPK